MEKINSSGENPNETPQNKTTGSSFVKKFLFQKRQLVLACITICLLLIACGLLLRFGKSFHHGSQAVVVKPAKKVNYFSVVSVSPQDNSQNNVEDAPIKITFSEPVRPDSLRGFFTESPMIPGSFTQGDNPNEVVFKANYTYGKGTSVRVILNKGFESIAGHKFTSDYTYNFFTQIPDNSVVFGNSDINSRWLNLPVGKSTTFKLQVGNNISSNATVTIYKGSFDRIVSSLLYKNEVHQDSNYVSQTYINYPVDTTKMEKISEVKDIQNGSSFDFNQGEGLYYVEAKSGNDVVGSTWISVSNDGLIVRQDDQKITIATQNIETGDTDFEVKVYLYNLQDKPTLLQVANIKKYAEFPIIYPQKVDLVVAETANGVILAPLTVPETQADIRVTSNLDNLDKIYLQTDRPTYTTQDTLKFSGILRHDNDAKYNLPSTENKVHVWIPNPTDATKNLVEQSVSVDAHGIFSGQFTVPSSLEPSIDAPTVSTILYAKEESANAPYTTSKSYTTFDVVSQNPTAIIKVNFDKNSFTRDENVTAHIIALDNSGKPIANKPISYSVYTKDYYENDPASIANFGDDWGQQTKIMNQPATLDSNGKTDIKISPPANGASQAVTLEVAYDNDGSTTYGAKTILVQQGSVVFAFGPSRQDYHSGDTTLTRVYANDLSGKPVANLDVQYEIYKSEYDSSTSGFNETTLNTGTATTDANGFALIKQPVVTTDASSVTIRVMAKDAAGNTIQAERSMNILAGNSQQFALYYHNSTLTNFDVSTDKLTYNVGDTANLIINSPFDQNTLVTFVSGRIYHNEWIKLVKGDNNYQIKITPELFPSLNVVFSYFNNKTLYTEGFPISVTDTSKYLTISTNTDKTDYAKNDTAQLSITTNDASGQPVSANVAVNVVDDSIFNLRNNLPGGLLYWNFYSPRIDTTNFSASTLGIGTGGGCGGGGGSDIMYVPNRLGNSYYWNPNVTTDQNGEANVSLPLPSSGVYRVFVTASSDATAVGQSQSSFSVQ